MLDIGGSWPLSRLWSCTMQTFRVDRSLSQTMSWRPLYQMQDLGADLPTNGLQPASRALWICSVQKQMGCRQAQSDTLMLATWSLQLCR